MNPQILFRCSSCRRAQATAPEWLSPRQKIYFTTHHWSVLCLWFVDRRMTSLSEAHQLFRSSSNNMQRQHGWLLFQSQIFRVFFYLYCSVYLVMLHECGYGFKQCKRVYRIVWTLGGLSTASYSPSPPWRSQESDDWVTIAVAGLSSEMSLDN